MILLDFVADGVVSGGLKIERLAGWNITWRCRRVKLMLCKAWREWMEGMYDFEYGNDDGDWRSEDWEGMFVCVHKFYESQVVFETAFL